jgi:glutamine amidotransferase
MPLKGPMKVVIVRTGVANLASVCAALRRQGAEPVPTRDPDEVLQADRVILPGVGAFGAAMQALEGGLDAALRARIAADRPTLAVCVGLQVLCEASEESPGVVGLGLVPGTVRRFPTTVTVPQLGWNRVTPTPGSRLADGYVYFANSYRLSTLPDGFEGALADHGGPFVGALERGALLACQFHPELSGAYGSALIGRWLSQPLARMLEGA